MIDARFKPLPQWKEAVPMERRTPKFKLGYGAVLDLLEYELNKLSASGIIIEAGFSLKDIRNDGWPFSGRRPSHPGVVLYFTSGEGNMRFPCGTFSTYEANLYAIALTLEHLRAIDRYGVTMGHQQYTGFKQVAAPMSPESAARVIATRSGSSYDLILKDADLFSSAVRIAIKNTHTDGYPDRNPEHFLEVTQAKDFLERYFATGMRA